MKRLTRQFFERPTLRVAKDLLGKYLVCVWHGRKIIGKIVETEAYIGPHDKASHAVGGKITKRNLAEYMPGGHIYIYLVYGMYWQFNISTKGEGKPECVLIRAVEPQTNNPQLITDNFPPRADQPRAEKLKTKNLCNGPGKLCKYFKLDKSFYGEDMCKSKRIWLEKREETVLRKMIKSGPRIGIDYAGPFWVKKPWRFWIKNSLFVSR